MEEGIRLFVEGLEQRFEGDDLDATPARVARAWVDDLVSGYATDPEKVLGWTSVPENCGPVLVCGIEFGSICVHHLLPFSGTASVAYLPGPRLAGLSKIGRVVDAHARRMQTQERLTAAIVETIHSGLEARGVIAVLEAGHTCMMLRGVRKAGSRMLTMATSGIYETDHSARTEILALMKIPAGADLQSEQRGV